ncbi:MAG: hypothetical protein L0241_13815, partial [Planctomycetia bacterium]|nr:hypothetical protein [Planctomycetia bacterium]
VPPGVWRSMPDVLYRIGPNAGAIRREPMHKLQNGLCVDEETTIRLLLPEPTVWAELLLHTEGQAVEVTWYARVLIKNPHGNAPLYTWQVVKTDLVLATKLDQPVAYEDPARPILRIDVRGVGCGNKPITPEALIASGQLTALGRFLDALAQNRQLANPMTTIYPELLPPGCLWGMFGFRAQPKPIEQHTYYSTFLNSPLYTWAPTTEWVRYEVASATQTTLRFTITDSAGFRQSVELHPADKRAITDWSRIRNVRNVTPAPAGAEFTAEAVLDDGSARQLSGRSSFLPPPTALDSRDEKPPIHCSPELTERAPALLKFLDRLVQNSHLLEKELQLHPKNHDLYEESFLISPLYDLKQTKAQQVLYQAAWDKELGPLVIRIRDFLEYDCIIRLSHTKVGTRVPFDEIVSFVQIQRDPDSTGPGEVYDFLILARLRNGTEMWLRGRSCYPIGECHVGCRTCLYRVCYETVKDAQHNDSIPTDEEVEDAAEVMVAGLEGSIQPIWRPDTYFAVRFVTRDIATRYDDAQEGGNYQRSFVVGWRTTGPLGHFHKYPGSGGTTETLAAFAALEAAGRADEFKSANLQHYLDLPRCYPNADGRLTAAKPLFYVQPRLDLFYLKPYVYEMYRDWDAYNGAEKIWSALQVAILDPAPAPGAATPTIVDGEWQETTPATTTPEVVVVDDMITNGEPCADVPPPEPIDVFTTFPIPQLEPLKLYTAVFSNVFRRDSAAQPSIREVHRYVFQTSRYASFSEQVRSWILKAEAGVVVRSAVYEVEVEADAMALAAAVAVLADPATSSDDLKQRFADPFDRLMDGILKVGALAPAATTEFNIFRLKGSARVLGILVRNPEPFNDPKIPASELEQTLTLSLSGGPTTDYRALLARDAASVFVTNSDESLNVPAGTYHFTFRYLRWDGVDYVNEATETAEFDRS